MLINFFQLFSKYVGLSTEFLPEEAKMIHQVFILLLLITVYDVLESIKEIFQALKTKKVLGHTFFGITRRSPRDLQW